MEQELANIRRKLKSLGYLESQISGIFVKGKPKIFPITLKISLIGALIFGMGFSFLYILTNFSLIQNFFDLLLLFLYISMSIFAILLVFFLILGFLIEYPLKKLKLKPRPSRALFHFISILFAFLITSYLFLWFKGQIFLSPYYFVFIFIPLSLIFIIFFRVFLLWVFLIMGSFSYEPLPSKKTLVNLTILILVIFSFILFFKGFGKEEEEQFVPRNTGIKIAIIGVDGFDISFGNYLIKEGSLPFVKKLIKNGSVCKYPAKDPRIPAVFWTTVATGSLPEEHNVRSFQSTSLVGIRTPLQFRREPSGILWALNSLFLQTKIAQLEPLSSYLRSSKTLWEIFSEKGVRIGQINWWTSWPADEVGDFTISERAYEKIKSKMELEMDYYPHHIKDELLLSFDPEDTFQPDSFISSSLKKLLETYSPDLLMVYLPSLDIQWEKNFKNQISDLESIKNSFCEMERAFKKEDAILKDISDSLKDYTKIFIFDPGRILKNRGIAKGREGLVIFQGYPFKKCYLYEPSAPEKIAPTVLFLSGFPISEKMEKPLSEFIVDEFKRENKIKFVRTFGKKKEKRIVSKFNRELLENLRSLGYIE